MAFETLKRFFRSRASEGRVIRSYLESGAEFGDAVSYIYMGECIGFADLLERWAGWERVFAERGYRTLSIDDFVGIGGYGRRPDPFPVRRDPGEPAVLHAELYRRRFLGKMRPTFDFNALKAGELQVSTYAVPSTEDAKIKPDKP